MKDYGHESFRDKNHSKKSWKEMNKLVGDGKRLRRKILRIIGPEVTEKS